MIWPKRLPSHYHRISTGTKSLEKAGRVLAKKQLEAMEGRLSILSAKRIPFGEFLDLYMEEVGSRKPMKGLTSMVKQWKKFFGPRTLTPFITARRVQRYVRSMEDRKLSVGTINRHVGQLKAVFNWGIRCHFFVTNPVEVQKQPEQGRERYLTPAEIAKLLSKCSKGLRPIVELALNTGMRKSEVLRLAWKDIDLELGVVHVRGRTKSGRGRVIPLNARALEVLGALPKTPVWVFPARKGKGHLTYIQTSFEGAVSRAELVDVRFHDLRHTFASHLVMSGVSLETVGQLLGHSTARMTMRYSHFSPEHAAKAVFRLGAAYAEVKSEKQGRTDNQNSQCQANGQDAKDEVSEASAEETSS